MNQRGTFNRAVAAIREAKRLGFRVNVNATVFDGHPAERLAEFFDFATEELGVEAITISPGYSYERAPDQQHFLNRNKTKTLFREVFGLGAGKRWRFSQSTMFLDFLAGNQSYRCTPWGNPTRNIFGWQKPCYLLGEGYASSFRALMEETDWDSYGTGRYEKCADCMVHCGYEPTAVEHALARPWAALAVKLRGVRTTGPMAPEIDLSAARPAEYMFDRQVREQLGGAGEAADEGPGPSESGQQRGGAATNAA